MQVPKYEGTYKSAPQIIKAVTHIPPTPPAVTPTPRPHNNVKQMVSDYEDTIIQPPQELRDQGLRRLKNQFLNHELPFPLHQSFKIDPHQNPERASSR